MNIMVFDVPAESGGALSVLNDFYLSCKTDIRNNYIFVISKPFLEESDNIKVFRYPWIKKSWLHRLYFDHFIAHKLIEKNNIDQVISLQNMTIPYTKIAQTVLVHNSLPFVEYRFSIFEDRLLWMYQNILSRGIFKSIRKANKVIVQTNWMKRSCVENLNVKEDKIEVHFPKIDIEIKKYFKSNWENISTFFYPASGSSFKNHKLIVEVCKKLKAIGITDYKVIFTLKGNENNLISNLYSEVKEYQLPIDFVGSLPRDKVFELYTESVLLFPSFIETLGLPLLEAKMHKGIILASDCPFSLEVLGDYDNAYFFNPFNVESLSGLMVDILKSREKLNYKEIKSTSDLKYSPLVTNREV